MDNVVFSDNMYDMTGYFYRSVNFASKAKLALEIFSHIIKLFAKHLFTA